MQDILQAITSVRPPLRLCSIAKTEEKACGFHLSRTQWDPYPWISNVDESSPAAEAGLTVGDFVIEVNGEDILGLRIDEVAQKVRLKSDNVRLLVWKSAASETENKLPALFNIQKFSSFLQSTLQLIECPVCLDVASSPTYQCVNGHILCASCRPKTNKCPMCRVPLTGKGRCLVGEQLHRLIKKTLSVKSDPPTSKNPPNAPETADKNVVAEPVMFNCPSNESCQQKLAGDQAVLPHLQKCHSGACVQYRTNSDKVTVSWPSGANSVYITRNEATYFIRRLATGQIWLAALSDTAKAGQTRFSLELEEVSTPRPAVPISSLSDATATILAKGSYFLVPSSATELQFKFVESKKLSTVEPPRI